MDPETYRKVGDLYHRALDLAPERRPAFLEQACGGDVDLRREVESLLAAHQQAGQFIEAPPEEASSLLQSMLDSVVVAADDNNPPLSPGQRLGRYEVLDLLGAGGMGSVHEVKHTQLGRLLVLKVLHERLIDIHETKASPEQSVDA